MGISSLLLFAVFFYFMMRFGCGAHVAHGSHDHSDKSQSNQEFFDPINGELVEENTGYGILHNGILYRFTTKENLDAFDKNPDIYMTNKSGDQHET